MDGRESAPVPFVVWALVSFWGVNALRAAVAKPALSAVLLAGNVVLVFAFFSIATELKFEKLFALYQRFIWGLSASLILCLIIRPDLVVTPDDAGGTLFGLPFRLHGWEHTNVTAVELGLYLVVSPLGSWRRPLWSAWPTGWC